jgi:HNH endonuclease
MPFSDTIRERALLACKRRCCLCEEHVHTLVECHHIVQEAEGGDNSFDNCIPLCLNCHGRVLSYNIEHPIGNKYRPNELKQRRNNFYAQMNPGPSGLFPPRQEPDILVLTPEDLANFFKEKTDAQAQKQIAPLIGKWMKVSGPLGDYSDGRLILSNHCYPATLFNVWTLFHGSPWSDLLSDMNIGTLITLQGQIAFVNRLAVQLIYCELLDV